jgi:hypothetical protein
MKSVPHPRRRPWRRTNIVSAKQTQWGKHPDSAPMIAKQSHRGDVEPSGDSGRTISDENDKKISDLVSPRRKRGKSRGAGHARGGAHYGTS